MPFNTKREHLEHLNHLLHNYPKRPKGEMLKQFIDLEHVLISLDIYDFKLDKNQDLWRSIRKGLAQHPLRKDGEALCKLRDREKEQEALMAESP